MNIDLPSSFRLSLTSHYGRYYSLIFRDNKLLYESTRPVKKYIREPTEDDWKKFWNKTVKLKIWLWESQYLDPSVSDGAHWSVNIEVGNLKLRTYGSTARPQNFSEFLQAVRELIPGLEFMMN
jgi:hypothetical protein